MEFNSFGPAVGRLGSDSSRGAKLRQSRSRGGLSPPSPPHFNHWYERCTGSQPSSSSSADDRVDWRLNVCASPYAEVREPSRLASRRPLCPPPPRTTHAAETLVYRSRSNAVQLTIAGRAPTRADDGPYFLIRYDGTPCRRDDNGSAGHGSSGSTNLSGSRGSRVKKCDPLSSLPCRSRTHYRTEVQ